MFGLKLTGFLLFVGGIIGMFYGLTMDTSVPVKSDFFEPGTRIVNISLIEQRRIILWLSGGAMAVGLVLRGMGEVGDRLLKAKSPDSAETPVVRYQCPYCDHAVVLQNSVCPHCGKTIEWVADKPLTVLQAENERARYKEAERLREKAREERELRHQETQCARDREIARSIHRIAVGFVAIIELPRAFDGALRRSLGEENTLLYRFAQFLLYVVLPLFVLVPLALLILRPK